MKTSSTNHAATTTALSAKSLMARRPLKGLFTLAIVAAALAGTAGTARATTSTTVSGSKTISNIASSWASKNTKHGEFGAGYTLFSNDTARRSTRASTPRSRASSSVHRSPWRRCTPRRARGSPPPHGELLAQGPWTDHHHGLLRAAELAHARGAPLVRHVRRGLGHVTVRLAIVNAMNMKRHDDPSIDEAHAWAAENDPSSQVKDLAQQVLEKHP